VASLSVLVVLVSVIGIGVQNKRIHIAADETATNAGPVNGVTVGSSTAVTIDLYEDFQCPACQKFQQTVGADLDKLITDKSVRVRFHMVAIYDGESNGNRYSSRAANASICASDISVADFLKYHDFLYAKDGNGSQIMPALGSHGRTDTSLINYGKDALGIGLTDLSTFQTCVQGEEHAGVVLGATDHFTNRGGLTTPVLIVNGKKLTTLTPAALNAAVAAAAAAAPKPKATPSATPTATSTSVGSGLVTPQASASGTASATSP
jgi:protein-disulfide isomerase